MPETISSNCLFHFTNNVKYLVDILNKGFKPRYCLEDFSMFNFFDADKMELAVPMVCFCDIPLSKVKSHIEIYGKFGIGLTKEWGIHHGVSPVFYINYDSETTKSVRQIMSDFISTEELNKSPKLADSYLNLLRMVRFTKPYQGKFWRNNAYKDDVRFYDEREWRFVPDIKLPSKEGLKPWIDKEMYKDEINLPLLNDALAEQHVLKFTPDDVKYIIIENDDQIIPFISMLEKTKADYNSETVKKLTSRIITHRQIIEDF